jgi:hypothetical protein
MGVWMLLLWVQDEPPPPPEPPEPVEHEWEGEFLPSGVLYRPYLASPRQSRSSFKVHTSGSGNGKGRFETGIGVYRPLARWDAPDGSGDAVEFSIEAAVFARFDASEDWDMDAEDYRYGFPLAYRIDDVTLKFHLWHVSSHLGDEYAERTGRKRSKYRFEEVSIGLSWDATDYSRFYGEAGMRVSTMGPAGGKRVQFGYEWVDAASDSAVPYFAMDLEMRSEQEWHLNRTIAAGILIPVRKVSTAVRLGVEHYRGKDQQTQFLTEDESYLSLVVAIEIW